MANREDIIEFHKKQLKLEINAIRLAISHSAVKGSEAESAFKEILHKYLPKRYELASGFLVNGDKTSRQHDIVIYDNFMNTPVYLGGISGLFLGGSVYGVLETTIVNLEKGKLEEDIEKIAYLRKLFDGGKVAFQKVVSCPIVDEEQLKKDIGCSLSSGYSIDDVWVEIKEKCISQESAFIGDIFSLESIGEYDKKTISRLIDSYSKRAQKFVVGERIIYSTLPPRTYLCALDGTAYISSESLSSAVEELTKKHGAHVHGLLVLNKEGDDWLLSTRAYSDYKIDIKTKDAFWEFLKNMKRDFQGMLVGKYPAADEGAVMDV